MPNYCIICWIKFLNNNKNSKRIVQHNLMKLCANCKKVDKPGRFTMHDALADPKSEPLGITCTLKPAYHKFSPQCIRDVYAKMVRHHFSNKRTPGYIEGYAEYTQANVLHMHFFCCCHRSVSGPLIASMRRLGYVYTKKVFDSERWLEYITKDQDSDSLPKIVCVT